MRRATVVYCLPQRSSRLSHINSHRRALVFYSFFAWGHSACEGSIELWWESVRCVRAKNVL